jgi:hypothetical protein
MPLSEKVLEFYRKIAPLVRISPILPSALPETEENHPSLGTLHAAGIAMATIQQQGGKAHEIT